MSSASLLNPVAHGVASGKRGFSQSTPDRRHGDPWLPLRPPAAIGTVPHANNCRLRTALRWRAGVAAGEETSPDPDASSGQVQENKCSRSTWKVDPAEMSSRIAKLGLAAVLAYGLFDGVTYTTFFVLAFLGYEKSTGKNPAANLKGLLGIIILMWTGNNITRPLRVAGAAALSPVIDGGLKRIQKFFNFPSLIYAFALVVSLVAGACLTVVGLLILSRWGK